MGDRQDPWSNAHDHPKCAITHARAKMHDHTRCRGARRAAKSRGSRRASRVSSCESRLRRKPQCADRKSRAARAIFTTRRVDIRRELREKCARARACLSGSQLQLGIEPCPIGFSQPNNNQLDHRSFQIGENPNPYLRTRAAASPPPQRRVSARAAQHRDDRGASG